MHKHMGKQLPRLKQRREQMVQRKQVAGIAHFYLQVAAGKNTIKSDLGQKHQGIDDEQIFYHYRQNLKATGTKLSHKNAATFVSVLRSTNKKANRSLREC